MAGARETGVPERASGPRSAAPWLEGPAPDVVDVPLAGLIAAGVLVTAYRVRLQT
jgi:hypothetical protein